MKQKLKFGLLLIVAALFAFTTTNAQTLKTNPFHRIPVPTLQNRQHVSALDVIPTATAIHAWRFTGPIAGYMYPQNQVVTGLGFGYQRLHLVDSTAKWYADYSISGVIYAGGTTLPDVKQNNIMSVGVSLGVLNQLIMVGPAYNLPTSTNPKGSFGVVFNVGVPLN